MSSNKKLTVRQARFVDNYNNPKSPTRGNAYQSAKKAGYSETYARNLLNQGVQKISENLDKEKLVARAEQVLADTLEFQDDDNPTAAAKIRWDAAKFTLSTTQKYSTKSESKTEVTGIEEARARLGRILSDAE